MTADRPATRFWAKAEEERRALQAATAARSATRCWRPAASTPTT